MAIPSTKMSLTCQFLLVIIQFLFDPSQSVVLKAEIKGKLQILKELKREVWSESPTNEVKSSVPGFTPTDQKAK